MKVLNGTPKYDTLKDKRWNQKEVLQNEKLNCITKTEWYPNQNSMGPQIENCS